MLYGNLIAFASKMSAARKNSNSNGTMQKVLANRYKQIKKLGSGNFGTAFLVEDLKPSNSEPLKVLKEIPIHEVDPDETVDAVREGRLLSKLSHPYIVKFYDSFMEEDNFCIVTEFCEGGDLDQYLTRAKKAGKSLDEDQVFNWLIQLLMAVSHMHERRVLHRDLKARNIFIKNNKLKIGDFGISRILNSTADMATTFTGTPYYMSPEVLQHDGYNSKSDVWSVGCLLYELCALKHAFEGQGLMGVMYKIVEGTCPKLPAPYSARLQDVIEKILVKNPDARPSAHQLLQVPVIKRHLTDYLHRPDNVELNATVDPDQIRKDAQELKEHWEKTTRLSTLSSTDGLTEKEEQTAGMTPVEAMHLRKQQKADAEAQVLKDAALQSRENMGIARMRKETTLLSSDMLPFSSNHRRPGLELPEETNHYPRGRFPEGPAAEDSSLGLVGGSLRAPQGEKQRLQVSVNGPSLSSSRTMPPPSNRHYQQELYGEDVNDKRPIQPMGSQTIYDIAFSPMQYKEEMLSDPRMAEQYYVMTDKFEEDDEDPKSLLPADSVDGEDTIRGDGDSTFQSMGRCLEEALNQSQTSSSFGDDTLTGPYGPASKAKKMKNMKDKCISRIGLEKFEEAYNFVLKNRHQLGLADLSARLRAICNDNTSAFDIEQIIFLSASPLE